MCSTTAGFDVQTVLGPVLWGIFMRGEPTLADRLAEVPDTRELVAVILLNGSNVVVQLRDKVSVQEDLRAGGYDDFVEAIERMASIDAIGVLVGGAMEDFAVVAYGRRPFTRVSAPGGVA